MCSEINYEEITNNNDTGDAGVCLAPNTLTQCL